jgi:Ca2+-binding RTX toxin-like protein
MATVEAGTQTTLAVVGGAIHFGSTPTACGAATTTNTDSILIAGSPGTDESLKLDMTDGAFAPGATAESTGVSEIEITTVLGDATDLIVVRGTAGADTIRIGQSGMGLNSDADLDVSFDPLPAVIEVVGKGGVNTLSARGGLGTGSVFLGKVILYAGDDGDLLQGGAGNDELYGGAGNDQLEGFDGDDMIDGAGGDDVLMGQGGADTIIGGAGADELLGSAGNDTLRADDDEADVTISGGTDFDTAYYDEGIDPNPVAEIEIPA